MLHSTPHAAPVSRRTFLHGSAAGVTAASLLALPKTALAVHAAGDDELKVALVGCGGRGRGAAEDMLHAAGKIRIWALADVFPEDLKITHDRIQWHLAEAEAAGDKSVEGSSYDVPPERQFVGFDAYEKAIASGADVVILGTPPGFRPQHFAAAVAAGKHVFMEKPVAVDAPGVRTVLKAAQQAKDKGLCVGVGLQRHHSVMYRETIDRLQSGEIGDILATRVYWNSAGVWVRPRQPEDTEMKYQVRNWYYFNWLCGDHIVEQHIHNLDVSNWLKGAYPIEAHGMGGREVRDSRSHGHIFDHHSVEYTYPDGTKMFSQCRHIPNCWSEVDEYAIGSKGRAAIGKGRYAASGKTWQFSGSSPNPYRQEQKDLVDAIRTGAAYNEAENGAMSTMTAILGRMATYGGKVVRWDEALASEISLAPQEYAWEAEPPVMPSARGSYREHVPVPGKTVVV